MRGAARMAVDWNSLLLIGIGGAIALCWWRWYMPYQQSIYKSFTGRTMEPGSFRYKLLQFGRWFGVALGGLCIVGGFSAWIGSR